MSNRHPALVVTFAAVLVLLVLSVEARVKRVNIQPSDTSEAQWFEAKIDHFGNFPGTWKQKYLVNDTFYKPGGALFLLLGGEGPLTDNCVTDHYILPTYAPRFNAVIVCAEHRFYGKSQPFAAMSTENLRFLTSQQALADFADLGTMLKAKYDNAVLISFGGSYSGALSAWFRSLYPSLVDMALATSAPVYATVNFPEYLEVVQRSLVTMGTSTCANSFAAASTYFAHKNAAVVDRAFQTCASINTTENLVTFWETVAGVSSNFVQYNNDNRPGTNPFNVAELCRRLEAGPFSETLPEIMLLFNNFSQTNCTDTDYYRDLAQLQSEDPYSSVSATRAWTYQTCNEFGYFQTTDSPLQPFPRVIVLPYFLQFCVSLFGITPDQVGVNVINTNRFYGARNINATRLLLPNGVIDPWHRLGIIRSNTRRQIFAYLMQKTAHCADLYPPRASDPAELTHTRQQIVKHLAQWVQEVKLEKMK